MSCRRESAAGKKLGVGPGATPGSMYGQPIGLKPGVGFAPLMLDPKKLQTPKPVAIGAPVVSLKSTQPFGVQLLQADPSADTALRLMLTGLGMDGRQRVGVPSDWYKRSTIRITVRHIRDVSERQWVMQKVYEVLTTTVGSIEADDVIVLAAGHTVIFFKPRKEEHSPAPPLVGLDANLFLKARRSSTDGSTRPESTHRDMCTSLLQSKGLLARAWKAQVRS